MVGVEKIWQELLQPEMAGKNGTSRNLALFVRSSGSKLVITSPTPGVRSTDAGGYERDTRGSTKKGVKNQANEA